MCLTGRGIIRPGFGNGMLKRIGHPIGQHFANSIDHRIDHRLGRMVDDRIEGRLEHRLGRDRRNRG